MNKLTKKVFTITTLSAAAVGIVHISNQIVAASAQLKHILDSASHHCFEWRFGKIYYTKAGSGSPVLLVHDTMAGASGYEWNKTVHQLAKNHTVYTIDLLGCGRSEKPGITYTNFLFVQLLCDFSEKVIKEKAHIIASGFSSTYAVMACRYDTEAFDKIILINPPSLKSVSKMPTKKGKLFKYFIEIPIFGTLIYHMIVSRESIYNLMVNELYYNPFHVDQDMMDAYYEASHKGGCYAKYLYACLRTKYLNINISYVLQKASNEILILHGEDENKAAVNAKSYRKVNPNIHTSFISESRHFPHVENPNQFLKIVNDFL